MTDYPGTHRGEAPCASNYNLSIPVNPLKRGSIMKYLKQFSIILAISCLGELLSLWIPAPIPGSIYGIVLLFLGLVTKLIPLDAVKDTGHFLVEIMPVMFIPAAAGLLESWELIASSWVSYLLLILVTTVAVMGVAGRVTQLLSLIHI